MKIDKQLLADPNFFQHHRLPAHSDHICYASDYEFLVENSSLRHSLNGIWKFHYAPSLSHLIEGFENPEYDCSNWDDIHVPAHIQMEGYDVPQYTNQTYPWEGTDQIRPGEVPEYFNPVASYVRPFKVPERFGDSRVILSFQGVESGFAVWVNGTYVGYSEDTFDPSEFDITELVKPGENRLAVRVWKWTESSWFEDQDFFRFSGIFRDVYLYAVPKTHLTDLKLEADLDRAMENGSLNFGFRTEGKGKIRVSVYEHELLQMKPTLPTGGMIAQATCDITAGAAPALPLESREAALIPADTRANLTTLGIPMEKVALWSAEVPNLYPVKIEMLDEDGNVTEIIWENAGFRRFEMKDGLMLLNGKRIVFKGVNRHEFTSFGGRVPDKESLYRDMLTIKQNNMNAIRLCHYPNDTPIYRLCDILGLYMIAENNMETHGSWNWVLMGVAPFETAIPGDDEKWKPMLMDRIVSCYQRDKNHPAILIWSIGNESFGGTVNRDLADLFRALDQKRLVHYEGVFNDRRYPETSDMESQMYPTVASIEQHLKENLDKPFICCEYTHAMGNSIGGMHKYTDLSDREPRYQGGFIWDYVDQSIYKKNRYGKYFLGYGGDFGDRPNDGVFSGNGIVYGGERKPSPKMQEVKFNYSNIALSFGEADFDLWNKNLFVNTNIYGAKAILLADGEEVFCEPVSYDVEPLNHKTFPMPAGCMNYIAMALEDAARKGIEAREFAITISFFLKEGTAWAKAGHEVAFGQKVFKKTYMAYTSDKKLRVAKSYSTLGVHGQNFSCMFGRLSDGMVSYKYAGREMLPNTVPRPNFWRAPNANDDGSCMQYRYAQWKIASLYPAAKTKSLFDAPGPVVEIHDTDVIVKYTHFLPTEPKTTCEITYQVFGDGTVQVTLYMDPKVQLHDMPEFGMMFKLDADLENLTWYGLGKEETYVDRCRGGRLGIWKNKVVDNMAEYLVPQECGNHRGVRWATLTDVQGKGMLFFGDELSFNALPWTPHEVENAMHPYELPPIHYTVVRVAQMQMGIGGDDSWGSRVPEEYLIDVSHEKKFTFCFRGI